MLHPVLTTRPIDRGPILTLALLLLLSPLLSAQDLTDWLLLAVPTAVAPGPSIESTLQPNPSLTTILGAHAYHWRSVSNPEPLEPATSYTIYASTEHDRPDNREAFLSLTSNLPVSVRLNGAVLSSSPILRLTLQPGRNLLMLKTQSGRADWTFAARLVNLRAATELLVQEALTDLDTEPVRDLLDSTHINPNLPDATGLTALRAAELNGNTALIEFLRSRGALPIAAQPAPAMLTHAAIARLISPRSPGLAILVARNGQVLFRNGYGLADLPHQRRITPDTVFNIGSITKQFTAVGILELQEQRKLRVADHVAKYLPDYPIAAHITIAQLLNHTSGIPNYTEAPAFLDSVSRPGDATSLLRLFQDAPLEFPPGTEYRYSNSNYVVLARIIEKVSGTSYPEFIRSTLLTPLGLSRTTVSSPPDGAPNSARGYQFSGTGFIPAVAWDTSRGMGAMSFSSTVDDLFRWTEALFTHRVISKASLQSAISPPRFPGDHFDGGYGYGLVRSQWRGVPVIQHGGVIHGFNSYLLRLPAQNFTVVILTNSLPSAPGLDLGKLARLIATFYLGGELGPRTWPEPRLDIPAANLSALTGRYEFRPLPMKITLDAASRLYVQFGVEVPIQVYALSETEFYSPNSELLIRFVKDKAGTVARAVVYQDGSRFTGKLIERGPPRDLENGLELDRFQVHHVVP
jgi:CubicO group peptidase (beta-lactamase class C family)